MVLDQQGQILTLEPLGLTKWPCLFLMCPGPGITGNDNPPCFASGLGPCHGWRPISCVWKTRSVLATEPPGLGGGGLECLCRHRVAMPKVGPGSCSPENSGGKTALGGWSLMQCIVGEPLDVGSPRAGTDGWFIGQHPALPAMALPSWGWLGWRPSLNQPSLSLLGLSLKMESCWSVTCFFPGPSPALTGL